MIKFLISWLFYWCRVLAQLPAVEYNYPQLNARGTSKINGNRYFLQLPYFYIPFFD
ncbi:MAG: hypothetical protein ABIR15_16395 [Chitinophagaceae bacterium]